MTFGITGTDGPGTGVPPRRGYAPQRPGSGRSGARSLLGRTVSAGETWVLGALIILIAIFTGLAPGKFLTLSDLSLTAQTAASFLVMAICETYVIITAGIDLSVGFVLVLSGVVAGEFYLHNGGANATVGTIWLGAVIGMASGAAFGGLQGLAVAKLKMPPLIAT
jgi:ribose transport system permease protein